MNILVDKVKENVVTDGTYSDYSIERIFSNRPAAEEYKKWHSIRNEIEEYEIYDEAFTSDDGKKWMFVRVQGTVYPEAVVDIRFECRPDVRKEADIARGAGLTKYPNNAFTVYKYGYVPAELWDEEKYKAKYTKILYDLAGMAKAMYYIDGLDLELICTALRNKDEEADRGY